MLQIFINFFIKIEYLASGSKDFHAMNANICCLVGILPVNKSTESQPKLPFFRFFPGKSILSEMDSRFVFRNRFRGFLSSSIFLKNIDPTPPRRTLGSPQGPQRISIEIFT